MVFQLGSSLLDACVLSVVAQGDAYGYTLTQQVREVIDISESTLYPVLRRLQKEGLLETYDEPYQGRNRRYYRTTDAGRKKCEFYKKEWKEFRDSVNGLLEKEL